MVLMPSLWDHLTWTPGRFYSWNPGSIHLSKQQQLNLPGLFLSSERPLKYLFQVESKICASVECWYCSSHKSVASHSLLAQNRSWVHAEYLHEFILACYYLTIKLFAVWGLRWMNERYQGVQMPSNNSELTHAPFITPTGHPWSCCFGRRKLSW